MDRIERLKELVASGEIELAAQYIQTMDVKEIEQYEREIA